MGGTQFHQQRFNAGVNKVLPVFSVFMSAVLGCQLRTRPEEDERREERTYLTADLLALWLCSESWVTCTMSRSTTGAVC